MLTLAEIAGYLGGVWHGNAGHVIFRVAPLSRATAHDMAYFDNIMLRDVLERSAAGVVLLKEEHLPLHTGYSIVVTNPLVAITRAQQFFSQEQTVDASIHSSAQIHPLAQLGKDISIGAHSVIGEGVRLADGAVIGANTVIEDHVLVGKHTRIGNSVTLHAGCTLGSHVMVSSGAVIGSLPFNYMKEHGQWLPGPQAGSVVIDDRVHIGANTVIDRGALGDTYLAEGVCIDNHVQIAHDVLIGTNTVIAGCAAIGAYTQIGADCIIGGASCIAAHIHLIDDIVITGMSTVNKSIRKAGVYSSGTLVHEHQRWRKNAARFRRLDDYIIRLAKLEKDMQSGS